MNRYLLKICSNEDIDLIEDEEEKEEVMEKFEDEIEYVYDYLKKNKTNAMHIEQLDDTRFNIEISTYKDRFNRDLMSACFDDIEYMLKIKNIAFPIIENYPRGL